MVMTIAIPSCFISTVSPPIRGPAAAMTSAASAAARSTGGSTTHQRLADTAAGRLTSLKRAAGTSCRRRRQAQSGIASSRSRSSGRAKLTPPPARAGARARPPQRASAMASGTCAGAESRLDRAPQHVAQLGRPASRAAARRRERTPPRCRARAARRAAGRRARRGAGRWPRPRRRGIHRRRPTARAAASPARRSRRRRGFPAGCPRRRHHQCSGASRAMATIRSRISGNGVVAGRGTKSARGWGRRRGVGGGARKHARDAKGHRPPRGANPRRRRTRAAAARAPDSVWNPARHTATGYDDLGRCPPRRAIRGGPSSSIGSATSHSAARRLRPGGRSTVRVTQIVSPTVGSAPCIASDDHPRWIRRARRAKARRSGSA